MIAGNSCASLSACLDSNDTLNRTTKRQSQKILSGYMSLDNNGSVEGHFETGCKQKEDNLHTSPEKWKWNKYHYQQQ